MVSSQWRTVKTALKESWCGPHLCKVGGAGKMKVPSDFVAIQTCHGGETRKFQDKDSLYLSTCERWGKEREKGSNKLGMVAKAFNPSTRQAEGGQSLNSRLAWSVKGVPRQPGQQGKTCLKTNRGTKLGSQHPHHNCL